MINSNSVLVTYQEMVGTIIFACFSFLHCLHSRWFLCALLHNFRRMCWRFGWPLHANSRHLLWTTVFFNRYSIDGTKWVRHWNGCIHQNDCIYEVHFRPTRKWRNVNKRWTHHLDNTVYKWQVGLHRFINFVVFDGHFYFTNKK